MIALHIRRRPASAEEAEAALSGLDTAPGAYFGVDAGIAGLHPLQATLVDAPALALQLFGDGLDVQALSAFGADLLAQPALAHWESTLQRGPGACAVQAVRAFLACFAPDPDVLLLGALPFDAWQLARPGRSDAALGTLFFGERLWRRDGAGQWSRVALALPGDAQPRSTTRQRAAAATAPPQPAGATGDDHPPGGYARMVVRAIERLRQGRLVSLTLSQSYRRAVTLPPSQAFRRLGTANPAPARC